MKLTEKRVPRYFIDLDNSGMTFELSDVLEILEEAKGTDGLFDGLILRHPNLGKVLVKLKALDKNVRGAYFEGEKYNEVLTSINDAIKSHAHENGIDL